MNHLKRFFLLLLAILLPLCVFAEEPFDAEENIDIEEEEIDLSAPATLLATDTFYLTPSDFSPYHCDHDNCFWNLDMGTTDEEAIWKVLTSPVTVLSGKQREQVRVLARPEEKCTDYVGVVTCASQAVHILDQQGDWTLIEAYSSAEEGSAVHVFAEQFQGWG